MRFVPREEPYAYMAELRKRIAESRTSQSLSLRNIAKLSGIDKRTVQRVCRGDVNTKLTTVYAVCAAVGVQFMPIPTEDADADS